MFFLMSLWVYIPTNWAECLSGGSCIWCHVSLYQLCYSNYYHTNINERFYKHRDSAKRNRIISMKTKWYTLERFNNIQLLENNDMELSMREESGKAWRNNQLSRRIPHSDCFENIFKFFLHFKETKTWNYRQWWIMNVTIVQRKYF